MSTIASPRDASRKGTPTSSTRPSLDGVSSPVLGQASKRSRVALREYYNLRAAAAPRIELAGSEVAHGELDAPDFDAAKYVDRIAAESALRDVLGLYARVLGEVRALEAEKKGLVYDNYSKLIDATETIRKMQSNMDPLNPMASTLDLAITQIYTQASAIRDGLRDTLAPQSEDERRRRTRELAKALVGTPERLRRLVREGKGEEAQRQWEMPRRLLEAWKDKGLDVQTCIDEGDAAIASRR